MFRVSSWKSVIFVVIQFSLIYAIANYSGTFSTIPSTLISSAGIALGLWAVLVMRFSVNIFPEVRKTQQLMTQGPYKLIRHPMYTAVLLLTAGFLVNRIDPISISLWLVLLVDLVLKLRYEEALLTKSFSGYEEYSNKTKRLVPFVY